MMFFRNLRIVFRRWLCTGVHRKSVSVISSTFLTGERGRGGLDRKRERYTVWYLHTIDEKVRGGECMPPTSLLTVQRRETKTEEQKVKDDALWCVRGLCGKHENPYIWYDFSENTRLLVVLSGKPTQSRTERWIFAEETFSSKFDLRVNLNN